jgi:hypothetical protein
MSLYRDILPEREEIHEETNTETLLYWHEDATDMFEMLKERLAAYNMATDRTDDERNWAIRAKGKIAYAGTVVRRIERRMLELSMDLPMTVSRKERQREERDRIEYLEGLAILLQRLCRENGIEHGTDPIKRTKL